MRLLSFAPFALLAACAMPMTPRETPPADRIAAECRLLALAAAQMGVQMAAQMDTQGTPAHDGLQEGCPGVTARDTRPLSRQTASLRAATAASLPATVAAGTRAETVFRRMITRGVPPAIAATLVTHQEFTTATR